MIDGRSADDSLEIIKSFEPHLTYWVSEPDNGQAQAINKGMAQATGDIVNWLNSDDMLEPGALESIADRWQSFYNNPHNADKHLLICGNARFIYEDEPQKNYLETLYGINLENMICYWREACEWEQPAMFFPLRLFNEVGGCDESQDIAMDYDLWCRLLQHAKALYTQKPCAIIRRHADAKTVKWDYRCWIVNRPISKRYWNALNTPVKRSEFKSKYSAHCTRKSINLFYDKRFKASHSIFLSGMYISPFRTIKNLLMHSISRIRKLLHFR